MTIVTNHEAETTEDTVVPSSRDDAALKADGAAAAAAGAQAAKTRPGALATAGSPLVRPPAAAHLSDEQVAELGRELDAISDDILAKRGASDAAYIRRMIKIQRGLEISGRATLLVSRNKAAWVAGTTLLSLAKILENMEIGHNVLHGQWDWMRDPDIHSTTWEWDFVTPARAWQHTHNDLHHRWTNVVGKDNDVGYNLLRMDPPAGVEALQPGQPAVQRDPGPGLRVGHRDLRPGAAGLQGGQEVQGSPDRTSRPWAVKALKQFTKDYAATPAVAMLTGSGKQALYGTLTANAVRNVWAHAVIFCGHFPEGTDTFTEDMVEGETRGDWYVRQMIGSANISGSKFMHLMTGNLSHQIEHHLFPDLPSNRYAEVAPQVQDLCRRYGLPYTTGPF